MEIRESNNLFTLFIESFKLVNRVGISVFILAFLGWIASFSFGVLSNFLPSILARYGVQLLGTLTSIYFSIALVRLMAARAENVNDTVSDCLATSFKPMLFTLVLNILFGCIGVLLGLIVAFVPSLAMGIMMALMQFKVLALIVAVIALFLWVRFGFVWLAIAVRGQGPIGGLLYAWNVSRGHFWYILGSLIVGFLFSTAVLIGIGYGIYTIIPLYFSTSFDITNLTLPWYIAFIVLALVAGFVVLSMFAYFLLVFLDLDYTENRGSLGQDPHEQILPPLDSGVETEEFQTFTSTVALGTDTVEKQNLQKVYQPKEELKVIDTDEDRMPTILFDDSMAQEIEANAQFWQKESSKQKEVTQANDGSPVQVSKNDLEL